MCSDTHSRKLRGLSQTISTSAARLCKLNRMIEPDETASKIPRLITPDGRLFWVIGAPRHWCILQYSTLAYWSLLHELMRRHCEPQLKDSCDLDTRESRADINVCSDGFKGGGVAAAPPPPPLLAQIFSSSESRFFVQRAYNFRCVHLR